MLWSLKRRSRNYTTKIIKAKWDLSFNIPFKKYLYINMRTDRMTWKSIFYLCLIQHFQLGHWHRYCCLTLFLNLRKNNYFYYLNVLKLSAHKLKLNPFIEGLRFFHCSLSFGIFGSFCCWGGERGGYKTMASGMGKCRNWEIILWFISWIENITPHCILKMRHLRHWTKWICLIQHINWEISNAILDTPSTVNIILLSHLLLLYIFLPKCCSIQKLLKMLSVRFF